MDRTKKQAQEQGFVTTIFGRKIHTPTIDGLASRGIRFTRFNNTARFCPDRASLMTGLYPHQAGVGHMVTDLGYEGYEGYEG